MADKKISALTAMTAPAIADFLHVIDDNSGTYTNQKVTLETLFENIPGYVGFATIQAMTAAGAVDVTSMVTTVASSGAIALTLANGSTTGQMKIITMITDGGTATLTPTTLNAQLHLQMMVMLVFFVTLVLHQAGVLLLIKVAHLHNY